MRNAMTRYRTVAWVVAAGLVLASPAVVAEEGGPSDGHGRPSAEGGPSDGHGSPAASGLGQTSSQTEEGGPSDGHGRPSASSLGQAFTQTDEGGPSDGHGSPERAATGLGQSFPQADDVSLAAAWRVYEFEREGVRYLQVNGLDGTVHAAIGFIGDTFWALPVSADRVSTPQRPLPISAEAVPSVVYRSPDAELVAYADAGGVVWSVRFPDAR